MRRRGARNFYNARNRPRPRAIGHEMSHFVEPPYKLGVLRPTPVVPRLTEAFSRKMARITAQSQRRISLRRFTLTGTWPSRLCGQHASCLLNRRKIRTEGNEENRAFNPRNTPNTRNSLG